MKIKGIKMHTKKIIIALVFGLVSSLGFSQSMFDKFEDLDGVSSVVVNKKMFDMILSAGENDQDFMKMVKGLSSLKVFMTEDRNVAGQMNSAANDYLKSAKLSELMRVKDDGNNVKIYVREGRDADHILELFMHVNASEGESVILTLLGDIDLKEIAKLTKKMDIPGGEHLNKINQK